MNISSEKSNVDELHYKSLINLFKYLISVLAILFGVITWYIGNSFNQMKENLNSELEELREQIQDAKDDAKMITELTSKNLELYADNIARKKINEELNTSKIQALIAKYVTDEAKGDIEIKIQQSYNRVGELIPELIISHQLAYNRQDRPAIDRLNSFWKITQTDAERNLINNLLENLRKLHYKSRQDLNPSQIENSCSEWFDRLNFKGNKQEKIEYCKNKIINTKDGYALDSWKCLEYLTKGKYKPFEYYKLIDY